jgi:O-methyltransferase
VYILKRILVDRHDTQAHTLLTNCRAAMGPQGRVLVADPDLTSLYRACFDILMLGILGSESRIRTEAVLCGLFARAGLTLTRTIATPSTLWLVEGFPG